MPYIQLVGAPGTLALLFGQPDILFRDVGQRCDRGAVEADSISVGIADQLHFDGKGKEPHVALGGDYRQVAQDA